ncbi:MAG: Ku protein [Acidothermales bacterium]|nr:Ku protein [Acidothermales bacterium]
MARPVWSGTLSFGLVSVPVGLYSGTTDKTPHFHQFERGTADRVRNKRVNERTGKEVDYDDVVKGAEVSDGDYVIVDPDELDAIAPGRSKLMEINEFVDADEIDPSYYRRTYYLGPSGDEAAKPYGLLRDAMDAAGKAAIATFVMRNKEYLAAIRPDGQTLVLETLYFEDEMRDPRKEMPSLPARGKSAKKERDAAVSLIESMTEKWRPADFEDTYRAKVDKLIKDKRKGKEVVAEGEPPESTNVVDLMAALEASVDRAKKGGGTKSSGSKGSGAKKASAKKSTAKKSDAKKQTNSGRTSRKKAS